MLLLVIIVIVAVLFFMRGFILERYLRNRLSVGGNSNIELLNQLNSKWQLPEGTSLEKIVGSRGNDHSLFFLFLFKKITFKLDGY